MIPITTAQIKVDFLATAINDS